MSIYQTSLFSGLTQSATGLLGGVANGLSSALGNTLSNALGGGAVGSLGSGALNYATNQAMNTVAQKLNKAGYKTDRKIDKLLGTSFNELGISAWADSNADASPLLFAGGLSMKEIKQIIEAANTETLARKNFYVLEINDGSHDETVSGSPAHLSRFNLLTQSLDLNPIDISGEPHQIGSAVFNMPTQNGLTELSLTVVDDMFGTIKEWAKRKEAYSTPSDGTVMPAVYRTFAVRIIYGTNKAYKDYYNERYTMELTSTSCQLARTEQGLEEITMRFTQESTFMPVRF